MLRRGPAPTVGPTVSVQIEELLRRLALNDEAAVRSAIGADTDGLDAKTGALVRLAALLAIGAGTASCRSAVGRAYAAGATDEELVGVLVAVAPAVGAARLVAAAPCLALAIDYDVDEADAP